MRIPFRLNIAEVPFQAVVPVFSGLSFAGIARRCRVIFLLVLVVVVAILVSVFFHYFFLVVLLFLIVYCRDALTLTRPATV